MGGRQDREKGIRIALALETESSQQDGRGLTFRSSSQSRQRSFWLCDASVSAELRWAVSGGPGARGDHGLTLLGPDP